MRCERNGSPIGTSLQSPIPTKPNRLVPVTSAGPPANVASTRNDDSNATTVVVRNPGLAGPNLNVPVSVNVPGYGPVAIPAALNWKVVPAGWQRPSRCSISPLNISYIAKFGPAPRVGGAGGGAAIAGDASVANVNRTAVNVRAPSISPDSFWRLSAPVGTMRRESPPRHAGMCLATYLSGAQSR